MTPDETISKPARKWTRRKPWNERKPHESRGSPCPLELAAWFLCNPETGHLFIKERPRSSFSTQRAHTIHLKRIGRRADITIQHGYRCVAFKGQNYGAHRVVYMLTRGPIADRLQIDHLNGIRDDNRPENLRAVTRSINAMNARQPIGATNPYPGVGEGQSRYKRGKWYAQCTAEGISYRMTGFATPEAADEALRNLKEKLSLGFGPTHGSADRPYYRS